MLILMGISQHVALGGAGFHRVVLHLDLCSSIQTHQGLLAHVVMLDLAVRAAFKN